MTQRKLIVGCGYLGARVAALWEAAGHQILALTRSSDRAAEWQARGWTSLLGDLGRPNELPSFPEVDTLLFAVGFDRSGGYDQRAIYVDGLNAVLKALRGRVGRVIYISSSSVYGQTEGEWVDETSLCEPTQPGGKLCLEAEGLVRQYAPGRATVLRLSGIYGPERFLSKRESLLAGAPLAGSAEAWLNLIHVEDAARAVVTVEALESPTDTYLVSDDEPAQRGDYYAELARLIGAPPPVFDTHQAARHGAGGLNKRCRNTRLRSTGWSLRFVDYRNGLTDALGDEISGAGAPG